ncbi:MAG: glycosyltransferase [Paludibacteraceae bacterium]|nr:glycosyltransferase [Paludibacteraceae bacterium]
MKTLPAYSVCTSVYKNDNPMHVKEAFDSMLIKQTVPPSEIVLVVDGPISKDLHSLITEYNQQYSSIFNTIFLDKNQGLGNALKIGVEQARYEYIARMDSDDICIPNRFEQQLKFMLAHPECDIVGGYIEEFITQPTNVVGKRVVPLSNKDLHRYLKYRCPFNHMTIMMKKSAALSVGNYMDWHYNEDYYLWIRMALADCTFANINNVLVKVRVGKEMYQRRGGWKYYKSEYELQKYMLTHHIITYPLFLYNSTIRFIVQVMMPNTLRGWIFQKIARKKH